MEETRKREGSSSPDASNKIKRICLEDLSEDYFHDILVINDSDLEDIEGISSVSSNTSVSLIKSTRVVQKFCWKSIFMFFIPCMQLETVDEVAASDEDTLIGQETSNKLDLTNEDDRQGNMTDFIPVS